MDHLDESLTHAARFIRAASSSQDTPLRTRLEALFGLFVAQRAGVPSVLPLLKMAADDVRNSLDQLACEPGFDLYAYDAKLLIACQHAILEYGTEPSTVLGHLLNEIVASLRKTNPIPTSLKGVAFLSSAYDHEQLRSDERTPDDINSRGRVLMADAEEFRRLCNWIANESLFGNRPLASSVTFEFAVSFPIVLMQRLREYDLMLGSILLRSIKYLQQRSRPECLHATQFLLAQQCADGKFGYFARELSSGPTLRNSHQDLSVPITVSTIWSLAELRSAAPILAPVPL